LAFVLFELLIKIDSMLLMPNYGGMPKIIHINTPLWHVAPLWRELLHKFPMAVVQKTAMPFCHGGTMTAI